MAKKYANRRYVVERVSGRRSVRWIDYADTITAARRIKAAAQVFPGSEVRITDYRTGKTII